jgi:hypothetical protein
MMRVSLTVPFVLGPFLGLALPSPARAAVAACPPACVAGGGPASTDCFLQFGGITGTAVTCTDGDLACDTDGVVNGVCAFPLTVCVNTAASGCSATPLTSPPSVKAKKDPNAPALNTALAGLPLGETACTAAPYLVRVKLDFKGLKPGVTKLAFKASAGAKSDKDKLTLICNPGAAPSLANVLQPVFTAKCATPTCHQTQSASGNLNMETGVTYGESVGVPSESGLAKGLKIVDPGNVKGSYLVRKILAKGLARFDSAMPQGCPVSVPCLTDEETAQILTWINAGAPNN